MDNRALGVLACGNLLIALNTSVSGTIATVSTQSLVLLLGGMLSLVGGGFLLRGLFESQGTAS